MFDISWEEFFILIVAGLFILGPERLPGAAQWLGRTIRQVRDYASGARDQLKSELGPEFDDLRKPLNDLRELRSFNPKSAITKHLLDATGGYDPREDLSIAGLTNGSGANGSNGSNGHSVKPNGYPTPAKQQQLPLTPNERPPFDPDAT